MFEPIARMTAEQIAQSAKEHETIAAVIPPEAIPKDASRTEALLSWLKENPSELLLLLNAAHKNGTFEIPSLTETCLELAQNLGQTALVEEIQRRKAERRHNLPYFFVPIRPPGQK